MQKDTLNTKAVQAVEDGVTLAVQSGERELGFKSCFFYLKK